MFSVLKKISGAIVGSLEGFFFWYGFKVGQYPWAFVTVCLIFSGLCGIGLINFTEENNAFRLWIPSNSFFVKNYEWLQANHPPDSRFNNVILATGSSKDLLEPRILHLMDEIRRKVSNEIVALPNKRTWGEICKKIPKLKPNSTRDYDAFLEPRKVDCNQPNIDDFDWINICQHPFYCQGVESLTEPGCLETSILELWPANHNFSTITKQEIIEVLNGNLNPAINIEQLMNPIKDANGTIIGATALSMSWFGQVNVSEINEDDLANSEDGQAVDPTTLDFEAKFRDLLLAFGEDEMEPLGFQLFVNVASGYKDAAGEQLLNDAILMPVGFTLVGLYVTFMLGNFTCVENRALLSGVGLAIIGLTILVTYGLCSAFGLFFGPMHNAIPFLFLGIGIDDMFVIMQSLDNLKPSERQDNNIPQNIGQTMKHAGVAITVTSVTDIVVFAVGSSTKLPALQSFCLYCAVGIFAVFVFQATLFVACVALDLRRLKQNRNGFLVCYKHENHKAKPVTEELNLRRKIFRLLGKGANNLFGKIVVILVSFTLLGVGIWGVTELETKFESSWFLPQDSYVAKWVRANKEFFPNAGERVTVYVSDVNYSSDLSKIGHFVNDLENRKDIVSSVNAWFNPFQAFVATNFDVNISSQILPELEIFEDLSYFLFSPNGQRYQPSFMANETLQCNKFISKLELTTLEFVHTRFDSTAEHISGMNDIYALIDEQEFSDLVFPITQEYANWETDAVISNELYRNIGLSMACVFVTMLVLLADIWGSVIVMVCVLMTLVDVMGFMHFWGLTIDVVSSVILIISVGLCVDYSAHIAHAFLSSKGSRQERSILAVQNIGPAVLNGGFSTFLALVILATSDSYVFGTFFKVFFLVIVFGLFHGLVFLPTVLGLIGPSAYSHNNDDYNKEISKQKESTFDSKL